MSCRGSHFGFPIKKNFEEVYTREIVTMWQFHHTSCFMDFWNFSQSESISLAVKTKIVYNVKNDSVSFLPSLVQFAQFLRQWLTHIKLTDDRCKMITYQLTFGPGKAKNLFFWFLCIKCDVMYSCTLHNKQRKSLCISVFALILFIYLPESQS